MMEHDDLKRFAVEAANLHREKLAQISDRMPYIRQQIEDNDLVFGVWQDSSEPDGVGWLPVKGAQKLREIMSGGESVLCSVTAIPCLCLEQAEALRLHAGEPDRRH